MVDRFILGWEEWLGFPDLGLPAIKAKVDTGARTSALHAFTVEPFGSSSRPMVRFGVHPIPGRDDVEVFCTAEVVDRREVTSSNGERENRYVIRTRVRMGEREWPIEVTLTNRESMAYRMLLGRQAILDDMFVDATTSFRQPRLGYKVYGPRARSEERRSLRIVLLTRQPESSSNRRLARAIETRGHVLIPVDRTRVSLFVDTTQPSIFVDGRQLEMVDAVVVRAGRTISNFTTAIVRQLETLGALALNSADALSRTVDALAVRQRLAREGVPVPEAAVSHSNAKGHGSGSSDGHILADSLGRGGFGPIVRFAVVGARAIASMERDVLARSDLEPDTPQWRCHQASPAEITGRLAEDAARALELGIASVDIVTTQQGPVVIDVSTGISIALFERVTEAAVAEAIVIEIEQEIRSLKARRTPLVR